MYQFSIITPTFNRAEYLPRLYDSLCNQEGVDFEWIIVDDGSSDNTREVVSGFKNEFEIKYIYHENTGKPGAVNAGIQIADSHISIYFDSDDILYPNALNTVWKYFDANTGKFEHNCICVSGLCKYDNGDIIGDKFPADYYVSDHIRCRHNNCIEGDKCEFFTTAILKEYLYPVFEKEKNISPGIVPTRIALLHKTLYVNEVFAEKQFLQGGLSTQNYWFMYPHGSELYYNEASVPPFNLKLQIKHSGRYIFFAKRNHKRNIFINAKNRKVFFWGIFYYCFYSILIFLKAFKVLRDFNKFLKSCVSKIIKKGNNTKVFK